MSTSTPDPSNASTSKPDLNVRDTDEFTDQRLPIIRARKIAAGALLALTVLSLMGWGAARELPGIWGVLMGVAIGGGFVLATAASVLATSNSTPSMTMAVVLGGWLVKMVVLILLFVWLRGFEFYDNTAFAVTTLAALVVALTAEAWGVITSRTAYLG